MSDEGEKTCPLCAEEMDLTDQQLKPCKCGYEICVWCWHHIMDMAEKDESEGRCPACRSPYDKEKIVGMAAKCESRLVADIHMEKKVKSQKAKAKSTEGRKQLSSVRVIQRNLVYIVGLPLNLADEELLQRKDYFGLYGKVLKVSMSRTASGVIQQYQNNTCSVYITYGKEDEAIRCIQNVHGFVLDGRPLRACFGTTKYCHAWLRNVPCTNQDCLYLHEVGSQEDSFTKDEIISAYTRSRVQQITGTTTNNVQRRSGLSLPPPTDDYCSHNSASSAKPILKNGTTQSTGNISKGSPPNGTRSIGLPAAASWGTRGSNCQPPPASLICTNGSSKQKNDTVGNASAFSSAATGFTQSSMHGDGSKRQSSFDEGDNIGAKVKPETPKPQHSAWDCPNSGPGKAIRHDGSISVDPSSQLSGPSVTRDNHRGIFIPPSMSDSNDQDGQSSSSSGHGNELMFTSEDGIQNMCSEMSSMFTESNTVDERSDTTAQSSGYSDNICKLPQNQGLSQYYTEKSRESATIPEHMASSINEACVFRDHSEWTPVSQIPSTSAELEEDIMSFESQRHKDPEVVTRPNYFPHSTNSLQSANHIFSPLQQRQEAHGANADRLFVDSKLRDSSFGRASIMSNGYSTNLASGYIGSDRTSEHSFFHSNEDSGRHLGRVLGEVGESGKGSAVDKGESSIISNILSLDFDTWDESLRSPQNLAKFFGDDEKQPGSQRTPSSRKPQPNNQSRFSFARQEECLNQGRDVQPSNSMFGQLSNNRPLGHDFVDNRDQYFDKRGFSNGISSSSFDEPEAYTSNHTSFLPNKPSAVSRAPISAPPGFSVPSRAPPPGFASHERHDHTFDSLSGSRLLDNSSLLRNTYQAQVNGNAGSSTDIEFMDPAILAVGKGRLQGGGMNNPSLNFSSQFSQFENDARLQLLMSRTLSQQQQQQQLQQQQNLRFPDAGESYSHHSGSFGLTSRLVDQSQVNSISPFAQMPLQQPRNGVMSNGHWDGWSEGQGTSNNVGMAELLRNERVGGYNKFYGGGVYEDSKFRMPSSDLYNRTFGM